MYIEIVPNRNSRPAILLREGWREGKKVCKRTLSALLFDDQTLPVARKRRDPVAPAEPSAAARRKKTERETDDGFPIHSFATLMAELGTRCRHLCRMKSDPDSPAFFQDTLPTPLQTRALELIRLFPVPGS